MTDYQAPPIQRALCPVEVREVKEDDDGSITFVASTDNVVRDGSLLQQNWDLSKFRKNSVFLYGHDYNGLPIGKVSRLWVEGPKTSRGKDDPVTPDGKRLMAKVKFVPGDIYPFAEQVRQFYKAGYLHAVSVGFRPTKRRYMTEEERNANGTDNPWAEVFEKSEMLELSAVPVPMDADALKQSVERGYLSGDRLGEIDPGDDEVDHDEVNRLFEEIECEVIEWSEDGLFDDDNPCIDPPKPKKARAKRPSSTELSSNLLAALERLENVTRSVADMIGQLPQIVAAQAAEHGAVPEEVREEPAAPGNEPAEVEIEDRSDVFDALSQIEELTGVEV